MTTFVVIREAGDEEALLGLSLSYNSENHMLPVADRLAHKGDGHNKFLESIAVWIDAVAPRYFWSQFDTYRVGVTKQSQSSMHTILRAPLDADDFAGPIPESWIQELNYAIDRGDLVALKALLPEGFLQRRIICTNYMALQRIVRQRFNHRLPEWRQFCLALLDQLKHPNWIKEGY